jgi:hypothetical protein
MGAAMNQLTRFGISGALCALSATVFGAPANQDFESGLAGWTVLGNVGTTGPTTVASYVPPGKTVFPYQSLMARLVSNDGQDHGAASGNYNPPAMAAAPDYLLDRFFGLADGTLASSYEAFNGSGIKQTFSGLAGEVVQQRWNFFSTDDPAPVFLSNDTAFVVISGPGISNPVPILLMDSLGAGASATSGWGNFLYTLPATGDYTIGFGVVNGGDNYYYDAELFLDDFRGVPEPGSLALLGLALAGLGSSMRRVKPAGR